MMNEPVRRPGTRRCLLAGFAAFAAALAAPIASACECPVPPPDAKVDLSSLGLIFEGRPVSSRIQFKGLDSPRVRSRWVVLRVIRGPALRTVEIDSPTGGSASCGIDLELGKTRQLAARGSLEQGFSTDLCTQHLGWGIEAQSTPPRAHHSGAQASESASQPSTASGAVSARRMRGPS